MRSLNFSSRSMPPPASGSSPHGPRVSGREWGSGDGYWRDEFRQREPYGGGEGSRGPPQYMNGSGGRPYTDGGRPPYMEGGGGRPYGDSGGRMPYMDGGRGPTYMDGGRHPHYMEGGGRPYDAGRGMPPFIEGARSGGSAMDDTHRNPNKVFVGGLGMETSTLKLRNYMRQFGRIVDVAVLSNKFTGKSRCFGFCSFASEESVEKCMQQKHKLDGVPIEVRKAVPRSEAQQLAHSEEEQNAKIFVGGIPPDTTEAQLVEHFEQFGKVKNAMLMYDKLTHKQRGFAFVTFALPDDADRAVGEHKFLDTTIETKKATPKDLMPESRQRRFREYEKPPYYRDSRYGYQPMGSMYRSNGYYSGGGESPMPYGYCSPSPHFGGPPHPSMYGGGNYSGHSMGGMGGAGGSAHDYNFGGSSYYETSPNYSYEMDRGVGGVSGSSSGMPGGGGGGAAVGGGGGPYRPWKHNVGGGSRTHPY